MTQHGPHATKAPHPGKDPGKNPGAGPGTEPGTEPDIGPGTGPGTDPGRQALAAFLPQFYAAVGGFPDLKVEPGLSDEDIAALEQRLDFRLARGLKRLLRQCATISMNGLSLRAAHFGPIVMPSSEALVIGELYLHNPGDRLLMLPDDETVYYLEQRNGAITKLADSVENFFNQTLPRHLYG